VIRIFERKIVREMCGFVEGKERWRIRTHNHIKGILEGTRKLINSLRLRWDGHVERMQYPQMAKILQRLHWKEQEKLEDNVKDGQTRLKRIYLQ